MAIRAIRIYPDPVLRVQCRAVTEFDEPLRKLVADMIETMHAAPGIGLAAPQVGVLKRIVVIDVSKDADNPKPMQLVNPEIVWASDELADYEEGCLSLPDHYSQVTRPARVRVSYMDRTGETREIEADGLLAVCLQHEMDHLEGVLFVDHISKLKRNVILRKLQKSKKQAMVDA
jgi:peptide deformylase